MTKTTIFAIDAGDTKTAIKYCKKLKQRQEIFNDIYGNRAQSHYYNNNWKRVLSLGVYSDDNIGFARYRDSEDKTTLWAR